ncbi:MAG: VWA domain-containing protein [Phycisphaerales bacterium]|nr:VWA domain-containing protein [Phycisphaerales bacterium]
MPAIRIEHPEVLWLLLAALPLGAAGWRLLASGDHVRTAVVVGVRVLVFSLLVFTLAGLSRIEKHDRLTVIALADISGSVRHFADLPPPAEGAAPDPLASMRKWFRDAAPDRRPGDLFGLIVFDGAARAVTAPTSAAHYQDHQFDLSQREGTNIAQAIEFGLAMFPPDSARRLVLFSDGVETAGSALAAAADAAGAASSGRGVPIDVVPITYRVAREVQVDRIEAPANARPGQRITARIVIESAASATGRLDLLLEDVPLDLNGREPGRSRAVSLKAGTNVELVEVELAPTAVNRFRAVFAPDDPVADTMLDNNVAEAFTVTPQQGAVLVVDGVYDGRGGVLPRVLEDAGLTVKVVNSRDLPVNPVELQAYDLIVLQNVPAEEVAPPQQRQLAQYVEDFGGGLIMVGGYDSFGAGGWIDTPLDPLMPVDMRIPDELRVPTAAIAIVLDRSGSMNDSGGPGQSKQEVANEGAAVAIGTLDPMDFITVIAFSNAPSTIVPVQRVGDGKAVVKQVRGILADGGTNMGPALREAHEALRGVDADIRHVICLTDGRSMPDDFVGIARAMRQSGITLSTIAVGQDIDGPLLAQMAREGGGEFYAVMNPRILPRIFVKEIRIVRRPLIREVPFTPLVEPIASPLTEGLGPPVPSLGGLVLTQRRDRPDVSVLMSAPEGQPILAHWQAGLGRVAAFTSDAHDRWAANWLDWPGYRQLWSGLARTIARPAGSSNFELMTSIGNDRLLITLRQVEGEEVEAPTLSPTMVSVPGVAYLPDGSRVELRLRPTGPGAYSTQLPATESGHYVVALTPRLAGGAVDLVIGGVSRRSGVEFRRLSSSLALLEAIADQTGGRLLDARQPAEANLFDRGDMPPSIGVVPMWGLLLVLASLLFVLDVASRRLAWSSAAIAAALRRAGASVGMGARPSAGEASAIGSLRRAVDAVEERLTGARESPGARSESHAAAEQALQLEDEGDRSGAVVGDESSKREEPVDAQELERLREAQRREQAERRRAALAAIRGRSQEAAPPEPPATPQEPSPAERASRQLAELRRRRRERERE